LFTIFESPPRCPLYDQFRHLPKFPVIITINFHYRTARATRSRRVLVVTHSVDPPSVVLSHQYLITSPWRSNERPLHARAAPTPCTPCSIRFRFDLSEWYKTSGEPVLPVEFTPPRKRASFAVRHAALRAPLSVISPSPEEERRHV